MTPRSFYPMFATEVLGACRDFYVGLGFETICDGGWYIQLAWPEDPGLQIGFIRTAHESQAPVYQTRFRGGGVFLGFEVADVDTVYGELRARGHRIVVPLQSEARGRRHFGVLDPNGVPIDIYSLAQPGAGCLSACRQQTRAGELVA